jgi:hypothetical protein
MLNILKVLQHVHNEEIFKSKAISMILEHLWSHTKGFYFFLLFLYSIQMVLLSVYIALGNPNQGLEITIVVIASLFFLYELVQFKALGLKVYTTDWQNWLDLGYPLFLISTIIVMWSDNINTPDDILRKHWIRALCIVFGYTKWLFYFRVIKHTRTLIRIIVEILKDMSSFCLVLLMIFFGFTFVFMEFNYTVEFGNQLFNVYALLYANYASPGETPFEVFFSVIITFILSVVLLNLLIAIMGETYNNIQQSAVLADSREKVDLVLEALIMLRTFKKCRRGRPSNPGYLFEFSLENSVNNMLSQKEQDRKVLREVIREELKAEMVTFRRQIDDMTNATTQKIMDIFDQKLKGHLEELIEKENAKQIVKITDLMRKKTLKLVERPSEAGYYNYIEKPSVIKGPSAAQKFERYKPEMKVDTEV